MKQLQKFSKFLSDYTSIVVIAIAVITFFLPSLMGWVNFQLFTDPVANKFTSQSIIIGVIMFSMGLTLTTEDFKILAQRPFDICIGAIAQYLIMPFLAFFITKLLHLPTGIALEIPVGYAGLIYARSGLSCKQGLAPANKVGVIDADYRGEIIVALHNHGDSAKTVEPGDRIAQMVITPFLTANFIETDELNDTVRGEGGFGSSGKN